MNPTATIAAPASASASAERDAVRPIRVTRRTVDSVLVSLGAVATVAFVVAASLLTWGSSFASDYVGDELSSQHITFPSAEDLRTEGRPDLLKYADQKLDTGREAEAYASYIDGHLQKIGGGATYADLSAPESAAKQAVTDAKTAGKSPAEIADLQAKADTISNQRNTLFKGETLRGLLLSAYAWSTVGRIAGYAAIAAYAAAALMAGLVVLGYVHLRRIGRH